MEQQDYVDQISLLQSKLNHLEEALKIEEKEKEMSERLSTHKLNAAKEAELLSRKQKEKLQEEMQLQEEEGKRKKLMKNFTNDSDSSPTTKFLANLEGNLHNLLFQLAFF